MPASEKWFLCFFQSNCTDRRTSCQPDQVVSGGLCCSRKKNFKKAPGLIFPDCSLLPGQKKDFSTTRKTGRSVTKLQLAPHRARAELHGSARLCWRGLLDRAFPEHSLLHCLLSLSSFHCQLQPLTERSMELLRYKKENFLHAYFLCMTNNVSEKNFSDGRALQS